MLRYSPPFISDSSEKATLQKENHLIPGGLSYALPKTTIGLLRARHLFRGFSVSFGGWHLVRGTCYFTIAAHPPQMPLLRASAAVRRLPTPTQPSFFTEYETDGMALRKFVLQECESKTESPFDSPCIKPSACWP